MKKFYHLESCSTCQKIKKELDMAGNVEMREIKSEPLTPDEVDSMAKKAGSYEAIFSKRARKYRELGLHNETLGEKDFRKYLLTDYTFLKRPVLETPKEVIAGNSRAAVEAMRKSL